MGRALISADPGLLEAEEDLHSFCARALAAATAAMAQPLDEYVASPSKKGCDRYSPICVPEPPPPVARPRPTRPAPRLEDEAPETSAAPETAAPAAVSSALLPALCEDAVAAALAFAAPRDLAALAACGRGCEAFVRALPEDVWRAAAASAWPAVVAACPEPGAVGRSHRTLCLELGGRRCACCGGALEAHPAEYAGPYAALAAAVARLRGAGDAWRHAPLKKSGSSARESWYRSGSSLTLHLRGPDARLCWSSAVDDAWRVKFSMAPPEGPPKSWTLVFTRGADRAVRLGSVYEATRRGAPTEVIAEFAPRDLKGRRVAAADELRRLARSPSGLRYTASSRLAELQWRVADGAHGDAAEALAEARRLDDGAAAVGENHAAFHAALAAALAVVFPAALSPAPETTPGRHIRLGGA